MPKHFIELQPGQLHPDLQKDLEHVLTLMRTVSNTYYQGAQQSGCHAFIEFCGLQSEYVTLCEDALRAGIDFTTANVHTGEHLPLPSHRRAYLVEKLECIYGPGLFGHDALLTELKTRFPDASSSYSSRPPELNYLDAVDALLTRVKELDEHADESHQLRSRLSHLLTHTANALKGEPDQITLHDWSDLPRVSEALVKRLALTEKQLSEFVGRVDALEALLEERDARIAQLEAQEQSRDEDDAGASL
jgi:hypothetical protein